MEKGQKSSASYRIGFYFGKAVKIVFFFTIIGTIVRFLLIK